MSINHSEILNQGLVLHEGFPYPDWKAIHDWARAQVPEDGKQEFWEAISSEWIDKIRERLGEGMECDESERVALISNQAQDWCEKLLDFTERSLDVIQTRLRGVAKFEGHGRHVVIVMP